METYLNVVDKYVWNSKQKMLTENQLHIPGLQMIGHSLSVPHGGPLSTHVHRDCMEIVYVVSGSQYYSIYGKEYKVSGNQFFITPENTPHSTGNQPHGRYEIYVIKLYKKYCENFLFMAEPYGKLLHTAVLSLNQVVLSPVENLKHKWDKAFFHLSQDDLLENLHGRILLQELLLDLCECSEPEKPAVSLKISETLSYITAHITETVTLDELADFCGLSLSRFKQRFREEMGISPREYINVRKVETAKKLLQSGKSITDTAFELSFSSSNYFSVVFKQVTGQTPKTYAKAHRPAEE